MTAAKQRALDIIQSMPDDSKMYDVVQILESVLNISDMTNIDSTDSVEAYQEFEALCKPAPKNFDFNYDKIKLEAMEDKYGSVS